MGELCTQAHVIHKCHPWGQWSGWVSYGFLSLDADTYCTEQPAGLIEAGTAHG